HNASRAPHPRRRGAGLPRRAAGAARQERVSQESTTPGQRPGAASAARDCEADEEAARGLPQGCPPGSSLPRTPVRGTILVDVFNPNPFMWGAQRAAMAPDAPRRSPEPKKRRRAGGAEAPGAEALDPQPAAPPAEGPAAAEGDVAAPAPAAAAAGLGGGEGRPAAGGRGLPEVLAAWEALQPRLAELRGAAAAQRAGWQELLRSAQRAAARTDAELAAEQAELGERRYGPRASHFCTLPPSVALLVQLGAHNPEEAAFARELEAACGAVAEVKGQLLALVKAAKDRDDRDALRDLGPRLAVLSKEMKALGGLDGDVGKRLTVASRRVTQYRSGQEVRTVEPDGLGHVEPSFNGYIKILDYYRLSDAASYSFGRQMAGPQHFTDIRRNVAVLEVCDDAGASVYNAFAVSGVDAVGAEPGPAGRRLFTAQSVADGLGETYSREHDAEFKLCAQFCERIGAGSGTSARWRGRAVLFLEQEAAVRQLLRRVPGAAAEAAARAAPGGGRGRGVCGGGRLRRERNGAGR
ncbi:unnamed protein product, partial [Prorocentrum cordatum]